MRTMCRRVSLFYLLHYAKFTLSFHKASKVIWEARGCLPRGPKFWLWCHQCWRHDKLWRSNVMTSHIFKFKHLQGTCAVYLTSTVNLFHWTLVVTNVIINVKIGLWCHNALLCKQIKQWQNMADDKHCHGNNWILLYNFKNSCVLLQGHLTIYFDYTL